MPFEWNGHIVVTKDELVPNWYTWPNLKQLLHRYKDSHTGPKRLQLGGNGRLLLIDFDTLPEYVKHGLGDPRLAGHVLEKYYKNDRDAIRFFQTYQFDGGGYLDFQYQEKYIVNTNVLNALISYRKEAEKLKKQAGGIDEILRQNAISFQRTLHTKFKLQHTLPESLKRFKAVLNGFERQGYISLISGKHGNDNSRKVTSDTVELLESMFAKDTTKPTATEVHRRYDAFIIGNLEIINNNTGEVFNPSDFKTLSKSTVTGYLSDWESKIGTYANRSVDRQKYLQAFKPYHSLDKPKFAGSIISIDDRQPPFKTHDGKRLWFYNGIDLGSEAFTCWVYGKTKEGIIIEFYRQLVRNYAEWGLCLPNELEAEMSLNGSFVNTILREGVMFQDVRIEANNARGKRIEAYYRPLRYDLEKKREGWLARPFALSESNQAGSHEVKAQHQEDIINGCLQDIETWNNMPHSVHKHLTRWEVFMQMQNPNLKPINYNAILPHLGYKTTTSCNAGIIRLKSAEFLLGHNGEVCVDAERLISLMKKVEGHTIDVYWLDDNEGSVLRAMVCIGTLPICEAVAKPRYNRAKIEQGAEDVAAREIMSKYVAIIEAYGRMRKQSIEAVTIIDNTPQRKKTFIMPGLKQNRIADDNLPKRLPDPTPDYDIPPEKSFVRTLKDRF